MKRNEKEKSVHFISAEKKYFGSDGLPNVLFLLFIDVRGIGPADVFNDILYNGTLTEAKVLVIVP